MSPLSSIDLAFFLATTDPNDNTQNRKKAPGAMSKRDRRTTSLFSKFNPAVKRNSILPKHVPLPVKYVANPPTTDDNSSSRNESCTPSSSTTTITTELASSFPQVPPSPPQIQSSSLSQEITPAPVPARAPASASAPVTTSCPHCAQPISVPSSPLPGPRERRISCPAAIKYVEQPQTKLRLTSQEAKTLLQMIEGLQKQIIKEKSYRQALEDALYLNM